MCISANAVRAKSVTDEFALVPDATILEIVGEVCRNRRQLVRDRGVARTGSNTTADLIALEVAHHLKTALVSEGGGNPNEAQVVGAVKSGEFREAGSTSKITRAVEDATLSDLIDNEWALTSYGRRWHRLWIALPDETTTVAGPTSGCLPVPGTNPLGIWWG